MQVIVYTDSSTSNIVAPTLAQKLASAGLTVADLKILLGLA